TPQSFPRPDALRPSFFNATAPPASYTLSLHDALPISRLPLHHPHSADPCQGQPAAGKCAGRQSARRVRLEPPLSARVAAAIALQDRKSTRLNSSHVKISYAVFCLKKKNTNMLQHETSV